MHVSSERSGIGREHARPWKFARKSKITQQAIFEAEIFAWMRALS